MIISTMKIGKFDAISKVEGVYANSVVAEVTNSIEQLYYRLCEEFGIYSPRKLYAGIFVPNEETKYVGGVTNLTARETDPVFVHVNLGTLRRHWDRTFEEVIPHEVCHAVIVQIYPETLDSVENYHGKEWAELMKYLRLAPNTKMGFSQEEIRMIGLCQYL